MNDYKLTAELVPETAWYSSLRNLLPKSEWNRIRNQVKARQDNKCAVCGAAGTLYCHEVWEYNETQHVQRLSGFVALCALCHHVKHLGMANILAKQGKLNYEDVVQHFMRINECDREEFLSYRDHVFDQWEERSEHAWTPDFGEYSELIQQSGG